MSPKRRALTAILDQEPATEAPDQAIIPPARPADIARRSADAVHTKLVIAPEPGGRRRVQRPAVVAVPARRRKAVRAAGPPPEAQDQVMAARLSARDTPRTWTTHSIRLPAALAQALRARVVADSDRTGDDGLAVCHYVEAALTTIPESPGRAAELGIAWRQANRSVATADHVSGTRLRRDTAQRMKRLTRHLGLLDATVRAWEVHAAAVAALLEQLDGGSAGTGADGAIDYSPP
jgi:hypothetical protein